LNFIDYSRNFFTSIAVGFVLEFRVAFLEDKEIMGAFAQVAKSACQLLYVCPPVRPSVCPHLSVQHPPYGYS
jgi:hypothetical protein